MSEMVDLYCERTSPDFWAEPINALTNVSFLIAAWFAWRRAKNLEATTQEVRLLLALMCVIGIGSGLFHTFANNWSQFLDVLPILLFQLVYVWLYCRHIVKIRFSYAFGIVLGYLVAVIIGRQFSHVLNGSLIYAPAMLVLLVIAGYHSVTRRFDRYMVQGAAAVFAVSLICRTVDVSICPYFRLGTHFMWHVCNAIVLYLLLNVFLANRRIEPRPNNAMEPTR